MPERLSEELRALRTRAAQFTERLRSAKERSGAVAAAREAGFFQMTQPERHGGTAAGPLALTVLGCSAPIRNFYLFPSHL